MSRLLTAAAIATAAGAGVLLARWADVGHLERGMTEDVVAHELTDRVDDLEDALAGASLSYAVEAMGPVERIGARIRHRHAELVRAEA